MVDLRCAAIRCVALLASAALATTAPDPVTVTRFPGVCWSPDFALGVPTRDALMQDARVLRQHVDSVRLYESWGNGARALFEALDATRHDAGATPSVVLGVRVDQGEARFERELTEAVALARDYAHLIRFVVVGNETLLARSLTPPQLIEYVRRVRAAFAEHGLQIPLTTAEIDTSLDEALLAEVDLVALQYHAFWSTGVTSVEEAAHMLAEKVLAKAEALRRDHDLTLVVTEVGWPHGGPSSAAGLAANVDAQGRFLKTFACALAGRDLVYYVFEYNNSTYKQTPSEVHWGVFDARYREQRCKLPPYTC